MTTLVSCQFGTDPKSGHLPLLSPGDFAQGCNQRSWPGRTSIYGDEFYDEMIVVS
ncbi:MAG: hypothetical protein ACI9EF_003502 [Pseudohongiellaceae bacterium]|jgi:hypothetical protein